MMYNIVKGNTPTYLNYVNIGIYHKYDTRAKQSGNIFHTHSHVKSLKCTGKTLWNNLPSKIRNQETVATLKKLCVHYIIGKI